MAVPAMKPKFQPRPSRINATSNARRSVPVSATVAASAISSSPAEATAGLPKRAMIEPVKKLGPNMAITCHWIATCASA